MSSDITAEEVKARTLFKSQKFAEAADEYDALYKQFQSEPKWLTNRALCLQSLDKHSHAIKLCEKSISLFPTWPRAYEYQAKSLRALGRLNDATVILKEGIETLSSTSSSISKTASSSADIERLEKELSTIQIHLHQDNIASQYDTSLKAPFFPGEIPIELLTPYPDMKLPFQLPANEQERLKKLVKFDFKLTQTAGKLESQSKTQEAVRVYVQQAKLGCTCSMSNLVRIYKNGDKGFRPDVKQAIYWAQRCLNHGPSPFYEELLGGVDKAIAACQEALGSAYRHGIGIERNLTEAKRFLSLAAESGDPLSMNNYASFLTQNMQYELSVSFYRKAATAGYARAMLNLGNELSIGRGCELDVKEAEHWLSKALKLGDSLAIQMLQKMICLNFQGVRRMKALEGVRDKLKLVKEMETSHGGVRPSTMLMEADLLLCLQKEEDELLTNLEVRNQLTILGESFSLPEEFASKKETTSASYKEYLLGLLMSHRRVTEKEKAAADAAEQACRVQPNAEAASACLKVGQIFGKKSDSHQADALRFFSLASSAGNMEGCFLAGVLQGKSSKATELRKAQKYFKKAASQGHPQAADALQALNQRLKGGTKSNVPPGESTNVEGSLSSEIKSSIDRIQPNFSEQDCSVILEFLESQTQVSSNPSQDIYTVGGLVPPAVIDQIRVMEVYLDKEENHGSYTGRCMLYSLRHFLVARAFMSQGDFARAVKELYLAYIFDEKGISIECAGNKRSNVPSLAPDFLRCFQFIDEQFVSNPRDFELVCLKIFTAQRMETRLYFSELAVQLSPPHLLPKMLKLRGCMAMFSGNFVAGKEDFERALSILETNNSSSFWPYHPEDLTVDWNSMRSVMKLSLEAELGRSALQTATKDLYKAKRLLHKFQANAPPDTHWYWQSFADLSEAKIGIAEGKNLFPDVEELKQLVSESNRTMALRLPVFPKVNTKEDFPKFDQLNTKIKMYEQFFSRGKKGKKAPPPDKCWGCDVASESLNKCSICKLAKYCSKDCQKKHW
eukprot:CAMPEP_0196598036 /NCGR_PEP_ID=MMETSP1081-20130531/94082_1 /TAXON_ID=36882 /ORGANISM="Pyramimonas amylifera, Strain CCMP720" /LENGTH=1014 /DNA_ID=CAMNT_0041923659 /DNA_START=67 /DNA_END=3108 /DNA_ORIENTATION=-